MMSQSVLAGIVGSTRSRVNYFMNRFERLGFIERAGGLTVKRSLLRVSQETNHAR
jgi:CRP/FNR family transcriptional regulator, cyclic AMP receptor protein